MRYIDIHDSEAILRALDLTEPEVPIDLVLHTPGGLALAPRSAPRNRLGWMAQDLLKQVHDENGRRSLQGQHGHVCCSSFLRCGSHRMR
ncbi:SDH family Clp fold serine proteinase [Nannocystis pusilla]|uniref:SDH family Clp fold serine proteinase n=1 Tax=Nannocystis pusilla TaxID=889268 RepID=UPI003B82FC3E